MIRQGKAERGVGRNYNSSQYCQWWQSTRKEKQK